MAKLLVDENYNIIGYYTEEIEINQQEIEKLKVIDPGYRPVYNINNNTISIVEIDGFDQAKMQQSMLIDQLKYKLYSTDYQAIKHSEGLISDEEYAPIKAQRQAWREEINSLEK